MPLIENLPVEIPSEILSIANYAIKLLRHPKLRFWSQAGTEDATEDANTDIPPRTNNAGRATLGFGKQLPPCEFEMARVGVGICYEGDLHPEAER